MKEKTLLKISIILGVLGVFVLFILSQTLEMPISSIKDASELSAGKVRFKGRLERVQREEKFMLLQISEPRTIEVIFFGVANFSENSTLEITGSISSFRGSKRIISEKVKEK